MNKPINHAVDRLLAATRAEGEYGMHALIYACAMATLEMGDAKIMSVILEARNELRSRGAHLRAVPAT